MNDTEYDAVWDNTYSNTTITLDDVWGDPSEDNDQEAFKSINDRLKTIENRLSILVPDKEMLKKYEVLQDIYSQYKAAEALLDGPDSEQMT
jgi:hypothetical protein